MQKNKNVVELIDITQSFQRRNVLADLSVHFQSGKVTACWERVVVVSQHFYNLSME